MMGSANSALYIGGVFDAPLDTFAYGLACLVDGAMATVESHPMPEHEPPLTTCD